MNPILELRVRSGATQAGLAKAAGTSQPTIAAYERGAKSPTLRTLQRVARAAGLEAVVEFVPPMTREERRSLWLHRAIAKRLLASPAETVTRARRNLRVMHRHHPHAAPLLRRWQEILRWPPAAIAELVTDPGVFARELRHVTPFAGVLPADERAERYRSFRREEAAS
ncbi:MAG: helix-turn-helix domain-containing protein [Acidimicrobiia bacterium]